MRTHSQRFRLTASVAITSLLLAQVVPQQVFAQGAPPPPPMSDAPQVQQGGDPPARVGRLSQINGTVSFHTQDETQWNAAALNYPVTAGNAFWTDQGAQATLEVSGTRMVMAPGTELDIANLTDTAFQGTLPQGEVYMHVRTTAPDEVYAVQTPRGLVNMAAGRYGIMAGDTQSPTTVTVIEGTAQISAPGVDLTVNANEAATITGSDTFQGSTGPAQPDQFLTAMLNAERPRQPQQVATPAVVAAMPGGDDLSSYGTWADTSDYGNVWYPQVSQDWVPYRDGSWAYVAPWGWTWVDSDPWGFAPFHYGRWAHIGGRWGWVPGGGGVVAGPPVYAPALVTFLGVAAAVGIGAALAGGRVGWVPLGPREPYHPWYHASPNYVRQVNIRHVTNITTINRNVTINNFANRSAATVVPAATLTESRPVRQVAQRVDPAQLAQARPVVGTQPIRPATTTVGVTPAVAREMHLQASAPSRPAAPGPAIRPVAPVAAGVAAHPAAPPLHNPSEHPTPAATAVHPPGVPNPGTPAPAGMAGPALHPPASPTPSAPPAAVAHPAPGTPALRPPAPASHVGPPPVTSTPAASAPGQPAHPVTPENPAIPAVAAPHVTPPPSPAPVHPPMPATATPAAPVLHSPTPASPAPQMAHPAEAPPPAVAHPVMPTAPVPHPAATPAPAVAAPHPVAPPPPAPHPVAPPPAVAAPHPAAPPPPAPHPVAPPPAVIAPHPIAPPPPAPHPMAPPPAAAAPQPHMAAPPPPAPHPAAPAPAPHPAQQKRPGEP